MLWFDENGRKLMNTMSGHRENGGMNFYCKSGLTWSFISSSRFGVRFMPHGCFFDVAGSALFTQTEKEWYLLGFLCSNVCEFILKTLNPTMNYQAGNIKSLPIVFDKETQIESKAEMNVSVSKDDWDSFETSWDFKKHPLI